MAERGATPRPGTAQYAKAVELAQKIQRMAEEPVEGLLRRMQLLGFAPEYQRIVLEAMSHRVTRALVDVSEAGSGPARGPGLAPGARRSNNRKM